MGEKNDGDGDNFEPDGGHRQPQFRGEMRERLSKLEITVEQQDEKLDRIIEELEDVPKESRVNLLEDEVEENADYIDAHHLAYRLARYAATAVGTGLAAILGSGILAGYV